MGATLSPHRIYRVAGVHDGKPFTATVGEQFERLREVVVAILLDTKRNLYFICTANRGVLPVSRTCQAATKFKIPRISKNSGLLSLPQVFPVANCVLLRVKICLMDLARKLTLNEMCAMEERGETCSELEEAHREMASATANLRAVLPDFLRQEEYLRNLGVNPREYLDKIQMDDSVLKLSRELEAANLQSFSSIQKLMEEIKSPAFSGVRSTLAALGTHELKRLQDEYSDGARSAAVASS